MGPRFRVWSRRIVERLERRQVAETLEAGSIVVVDEAIEEGIAVSVRDEQAVSDAAFGLATDSFDQSTIEALDHAIGLRAIGSGEAVIDLMAGADTIEGMPTGRPIMGLAFHVDGEAIGELTPIVGQDRMHWMREVSQEAFEESLRGHGITLGMDLEIDVAGGAVDGDEGIALAPLQGRKVLQIDMNKADGRLVEGADRRLIGLGALAETVPDQAAMDGAARELSIDAAVHHFITSVMSSSGSQSLACSSQTSASSSADRLIISFLGVCERSVTVSRLRQRRTVVSLTPSSAD